MQKVEFGLIFCDEGHRLKNSSIKTSSALSSLSCSRRVILTGAHAHMQVKFLAGTTACKSFDINCPCVFKGTPVQNDLQEFYAIIQFVNQGILGSSAAYRKVYEEPILRSRQPSCTEVLHHLPKLAFFVQSYAENYAGLHWP